MSDYTVSIEQADSNTVSLQDIVNAVTVSELEANNVTVVSATFVNAEGASSNLFYSSSAPNDAVGDEGDFYIDTSTGYLWGPKGAETWGADPLPLIPKRFTYTQASASSTWNISHTLDGFPSVTVVDSAGTVVIGTVSYNSRSSVTVSFEAAFAGKAYLT
jgi:hypothetical protein